MYKTQFLIVVMSLFLGLACSDSKSSGGNDNYWIEVENDLKAKKETLSSGNLFSVFNESLTDEERKALTFLYAYMPIGDITDYSGKFYLDNIRSSFRTRVEMPWGKTIPEDIFRHYVLPIRVNNENLDESRMVFYEELKDRVKNLSLHDAVLEVNHWCHEKVVYTPSDARTSSALASVKTAYGRCGEESTFAVAALRSVGIPARQVYTPRWAHTDDNHAWVEAWVDGKWYFMGACEPEPVLNLGWFNGPAYRGMLMHTKVFGKYNGPEEVMLRTNCYTEINVIDNYAPTAKSTVTVVGKDGKPVVGADVEFKIYNYAEFYTVARKVSDDKGQTFLTAGKGDMLVWATKNGQFGYTKVSFGKDNEVKLVLDKQPGDAGEVELDIIPPVPGSIQVEVTEEQKKKNAQRLSEEDAIRNKYVSTFYTEDKAKALAKQLGINEKKTIELMKASRGNWREIEAFLNAVPKERREQAMSLLDVISAKDLRDTPASVLSDHLNNTLPLEKDPLFIDYILNPRVDNELLTPYTGFALEQLNEGDRNAVREHPEYLVDWVRQNIKICDNLNPQRIPMFPAGVWKAKAADRQSRNVFFVAAARSFGIPARIEPVAGKVQYAQSGKWQDVDFEAAEQKVAVQGKLVASYEPTKVLKDPKYYSHFSIAKMLDDAKLQTLNFEVGEVDMGGGNSWSAMLKQPMAIDEGKYVLVTGTRMASGAVLAKLHFFNVEKDKTTQIALQMRENKDDLQVLGNFNSENLFKRIDNGKEVSLLSTTGRGYYIVAILGARQEPTNHTMRDMAAVKEELEKWGRSIVLLFPDEKGWKNFDVKEFGELPNTITYGIDTNHVIQQEIVENMKLSNANTLPIFIVADTFNRVVFVSQGYTIGLGEQLMKVIHKL